MEKKTKEVWEIRKTISDSQEAINNLSELKAWETEFIM